MNNRKVVRNMAHYAATEHSTLSHTFSANMKSLDYKANRLFHNPSEGLIPTDTTWVMLCLVPV